MFKPQQGDPVRLNELGRKLHGKSMSGKVESVDPNDEAAVKVRIGKGVNPVVRTLSVRHLELDTE